MRHPRVAAGLAVLLTVALFLVAELETKARFAGQGKLASALDALLVVVALALVLALWFLAGWALHRLRESGQGDRLVRRGAASEPAETQRAGPSEPARDAGGRLWS